MKMDLYMHSGKRLISLYPEDKGKLDEKLAGKLRAMQQEGASGAIGCNQGASSG